MFCASIMPGMTFQLFWMTPFSASSSLCDSLRRRRLLAAERCLLVRALRAATDASSLFRSAETSSASLSLSRDVSGLGRFLLFLVLAGLRVVARSRLVSDLVWLFASVLASDLASVFASGFVSGAASARLGFLLLGLRLVFRLRLVLRLGFRLRLFLRLFRRRLLRRHGQRIRRRRIVGTSQAALAFSARAWVPASGESVRALAASVPVSAVSAQASAASVPAWEPAQPSKGQLSAPSGFP